MILRHNLMHTIATDKDFCNDICSKERMMLDEEEGKRRGRN